MKFILLILLFVIIYSVLCNQQLKIKESFINKEQQGQVIPYPQRVIVITLALRPDRFNTFKKDYNRSGLTIPLQKYNAINGKNLDLKTVNLSPLAVQELDDVTKKGFRTKHYQLTPGAIGCYLSHYNIWKQAYDGGWKSTLIFEDDAKIPTDFEQKLSVALQNLHSTTPDWDIFVLDVLCRDCIPHDGNIIKVNKFYLLHAYVIRYSGVKKIIDSGMAFPITQQIDWMLSQNTKLLNIYSLQNGIVKQSGSPTDIQAPLLSKKGIDPFKEVGTI